MAGSQHHPPMAQRIARLLPTLTRAQRRMADYVLAHPLQAATQTIDELATKYGRAVNWHAIVLDANFSPWSASAFPAASCAATTSAVTSPASAASG